MPNIKAYQGAAVDNKRFCRLSKLAHQLWCTTRLAADNVTDEKQAEAAKDEIESILRQIDEVFTAATL